MARCSFLDIANRRSSPEGACGVAGSQIGRRAGSLGSGRTLGVSANQGMRLTSAIGDARCQGHSLPTAAKSGTKSFTTRRTLRELGELPVRPTMRRT